MTSTGAWYDTMDSPVGPLFIGGTAEGLSHVEFLAGHGAVEEHRARLEAAAGASSTRGGEVCAEAMRQIGEYFAGTRLVFDLPLAPHGTAWQQQVWAALREIPPGETRSYGAIAARLGRPTASRAVGAANGRNPVAIVVPCHRVIGADRTLTGYAGGMHRKHWLLAHEGVTLRLESGAGAPGAMPLAG